MTPERDILTVEFLSRAGWGLAQRKNLAGDASMRRYERLRKPNGETAVLMDAPPETNDSVGKFVSISRYLCGIGLSAPNIIDEDYANGLLLLEDLGDDLFARVLVKSPALEPALYRSATDVLIALHDAKPPELTPFTPEIMAEQASLVFETWVRPLAEPVAANTIDEFRSCFQNLLYQTAQDEQAMILRDYHAENLLWLPHRAGMARVGLLDFQDAMLAHPAYDLVSLLQDVRRDVSATLEQEMIAHYVDQTRQDDHKFRTAYTVLGVMRNLRILAVFARLVTSCDRPYYATLIPRTWAHLMRGLTQPALDPIATILADILPHPTEENLQRLARK